MDIEGKQMREQDQMPSQSLQRAQNPAPRPALKGLLAGIGRLWFMLEQDTESWDPRKTFIIIFMLLFIMSLVLFSFLFFLVFILF